MEAKSAMTRPALEGGEPTRKEFLPFHRPSVGAEEEAAVIEVLRSGWLTTGEKAFALEREVAALTGAGEGVAVSSGTAALHLALVALGLGPGDEVITTPITFASTINVIEHVGAKPVFVDVRLSDLNIDPSLIAAAITPRTRAIMPVHMAGVPCDMDPILALGERHRLMVVEDAAHALGAKYKGRPIGSLGTVTCFCFYASKNLTAGEGGMLATNDHELAERARRLRLHGMSKDAWKRYGSSGFQHWEILAPGFKYNLPDLLAAVALCQLKKFPAFQSRRAEIAAQYRRAFEEEPGLRLLAEPADSESAHHLFEAMVDLSRLMVDRDRILNAIQAEGIGLGVHFRSIAEQPYYREKYRYQEGSLPLAELASRTLLSLPLHPGLAERDVEDVIGAVLKVIRYYRKSGTES